MDLHHGLLRDWPDWGESSKGCRATASREALKADPTYTPVRLKPDTTYTPVRLKPDTTYIPVHSPYVVSAFRRTVA